MSVLRSGTVSRLGERTYSVSFASASESLTEISMGLFCLKYDRACVCVCVYVLCVCVCVLGWNV